MNGQIAHRDARHVAAFVLRPLLAAVERHPQAEFRPEEEEIAIDQIFTDDVRVAAHVAVLRDDR